MTWSDEATTIIEELVRDLPAPVRESVTQAAHARAEALTADEGSDEVSVETAVRAFIESTPADLRNRLRHALTYQGIDPEEYDAAFES